MVSAPSNCGKAWTGRGHYHRRAPEVETTKGAFNPLQLALHFPRSSFSIRPTVQTGVLCSSNSKKSFVLFSPRTSLSIGSGKYLGLSLCLSVGPACPMLFSTWMCNALAESKALHPFWWRTCPWWSTRNQHQCRCNATPPIHLVIVNDKSLWPLLQPPTPLQNRWVINHVFQMLQQLVFYFTQEILQRGSGRTGYSISNAGWLKFSLIAGTHKALPKYCPSVT